MAEEEILLEAIAATAVAYQLLLERVGVEADRPSQQRVQVLERNRLRMVKVDGAERIERRGARAGVADPPK